MFAPGVLVGPSQKTAGAPACYAVTDQWPHRADLTLRLDSCASPRLTAWCWT